MEEIIKVVIENNNNGGKFDISFGEKNIIVICL